jgi:hypothetical protein
MAGIAKGLTGARRAHQSSIPNMIIYFSCYFGAIRPMLQFMICSSPTKHAKLAVL